MAQRETIERKSTSYELNFLFKCISIVLVNFKIEKTKKNSKTTQKFTLQDMTTAKAAFSHDISAIFCLLRARSQTEVATSRARKQKVQI